MNITFYFFLLETDNKQVFIYIYIFFYVDAVIIAMLSAERTTEILPGTT